MMKLLEQVIEMKEQNSGLFNDFMKKIERLSDKKNF